MMSVAHTHTACERRALSALRKERGREQEGEQIWIMERMSEAADDSERCKRRSEVRYLQVVAMAMAMEVTR